jgi:hypothetical protein
MTFRLTLTAWVMLMIGLLESVKLSSTHQHVVNEPSHSQWGLERFGQLEKS